MASLKAVVLDVDGTVATCPYDFDAMRAVVAEVARRWGFSREISEPRGVVERIALIAGALGERGEGFRADAEDAVAKLEIHGARSSRLLPGADAALAELRAAGLKVALITRNCRAAAERVLLRLGAYDVLLSRNDVPRAKPDPDHVRRALAALGCDPAEAVVVGDHVFDMEAGRAAGAAHCLGVRTGASSDAELLAAGAEAVIGSIAELPAWLRGRMEMPS